MECVCVANGNCMYLYMLMLCWWKLEFQEAFHLCLNGEVIIDAAHSRLVILLWFVNRMIVIDESVC